LWSRERTGTSRVTNYTSRELVSKEAVLSGRKLKSKSGKAAVFRREQGEVKKTLVYSKVIRHSLPRALSMGTVPDLTFRRAERSCRSRAPWGTGGANEGSKTVAPQCATLLEARPLGAIF